MKKTILFCLLGIMLATCKNKGGDSRPISTKSLVFGCTYGYCMGDCAELYLIKNGQLFKDTVKVLKKPIFFKPDALSNEEYLLAKPLLDSLPAYLLQHADSTYGCPDCSDQGRIRIEWTENGVTRAWNLDAFTENNEKPEVVKYAEKVMKVTRTLREK